MKMTIRRLCGHAVVGLLLGLAVTAPTAAQNLPVQIVTIARGGSALLPQPNPIERLSVGDPEIADAIAVTPLEVLINARTIGTTSVFVWDANGQSRLYTIEVTVDAEAIQRQLSDVFPGEPISVSASGNVIVVSGSTSNPEIARRALEIVRASGATVVDNLLQPSPQQILLQVRFAEVSRSAASRLGAEIRAGETSAILNHLAPEEGDHVAETLSDGLVRLFLFEGGVQVDAVIRALRERGDFRSLAEPNLLALEGQEASFLAGGEFPFPVPQPGSVNTVTVVFKEYGIRLRFLPTVTAEGHIRLTVAPEVSSLDFANGLDLSGFQIPSLLTRRAETQVELQPGQTLAIAGLMDNMIQNNERRIPLLGDVPILGALFRSRDVQQNRSELLVLVTPTLVQPSDTPPALPGGDPAGWDWAPNLREPVATAP